MPNGPDSIVPDIDFVSHVSNQATAASISDESRMSEQMTGAILIAWRLIAVGA
jgi:hypothetical protein